MAETPEILLTAAQVRRIFGGISDMSLWRWIGNPAMGFPQPLYIARRRYWRESEVVAWRDAQSGSAKADGEAA